MPIWKAIGDRGVSNWMDVRVSFTGRQADRKAAVVGKHPHLWNGSIESLSREPSRWRLFVVPPEDLGLISSTHMDVKNYP